jgi:hypothetical protein
VESQGAQQPPHLAFFVAKLSLLPTTVAASFPSSAADIRACLPELCAKAALLCPNGEAASLSGVAGSGPFKGYNNANFTNYGTSAGAGADAFQSYSPDLNIVADSFLRPRLGRP